METRKLLLIAALFVLPLLCANAQQASENHEDVNIPVRSKMTLQLLPDESGFNFVNLEEYSQFVNLSQAELCFHPFYQDIDNMVEVLFANTATIKNSESESKNDCVLLIKNGTGKALEFVIKNYVPADVPTFEIFMTENVLPHHTKGVPFPYPIDTIRVDVKVMSE